MHRRARGAVDALREAADPRDEPSGAAGLAGLLHAAVRPDLRDEHRLGPDSTVLLIATEGALPDDR